MTQQNLFHESIYEALRDIVMATGGFKKVGSDLWPSLSADKAGRDLNDCLNASNGRTLDPVELLWMLRRGRAAGVHTGMAYIAQECSYEMPRTVDPESEKERLQREFLAGVQNLQRLASRLGAGA